MISILYISVYSQANDGVEPTMLKINFIDPGIEYEIKVTKKSTLMFGVGTGVSLGSFNGHTEFGVFPSIEGHARYYNNIDRRIKKGKNISNNSGNYMSLMTLYQFSKSLIGNLLYTSDAFLIGPVYGMQRTYNSGFNWGFEAGGLYATREAGFFFNNEKSEYADYIPWANFSVGWIIRNKNKKTVH